MPVNAVEKISTPHFTIIFHKSFSPSVLRIANTLETLYIPVSKTLGAYPKPITLLIDNQCTTSNGCFTYTPRRMHFYTFYTSDPSFVGNNDWLNMLCIHEFRHTVQYSTQYNSTPCWVKPIYFGANLIVVCGVPNFFNEGDAVGIETALSKSGRGRFPAWERLYKVNLLERGPISFGTQVLGSLHHRIPSNYRIGYYLTTHIRRKYGVDAIKSILQKTVRGIPYFGFYNAIKQVTKKSILKVYDDMNQELLLSWQKQLEGLKITPVTQVSIKKPNDNFDYLGPFIDKSRNLIAWKKGIGCRCQLVQVKHRLSQPITSKKKSSTLAKDKTILYHMPEVSSAACAIGQRCAVWLESYQNHCKSETDYRIRLQYYNFKQRKRRTLISSSRYVALAISPNDQQIVAITSDKTAKSFLVVLETESGKLIKKIDNPDEGYYLTPSWSDADHVIVVKTKNQKNSILRINVRTNKVDVLLPYSYEHRSYPKVYQDYLLYNSSYNGIDNIYAMHLPTKSCFQVTSRKYGAYLGMVDSVTNQLIFNDYSKNGMDIVAMPFDPLLWTPLEKVEDRSIRYYEPLVVQEKNSNPLDDIRKHQYRFRKSFPISDTLYFLGPNLAPDWNNKGINIQPFTVVTLEDRLKVTPYVYISTNLFKKLRYTGYEYKTLQAGLKLRYKIIYPIFKVNIHTTQSKKDTTLSKWQKGLNLKLKLPYYLTLSSSSVLASLAAKLSLIQSNRVINYETTYVFKLINQSTKSRKDICGPPWLQQIEVQFTRNENCPELLSLENQIISSIAFQCPGIISHHSFTLQPCIRRLKPCNRQPCWEQKLVLNYAFPLPYSGVVIPLIWFVKQVTVRAFYTTKFRSINQKNDFYSLLSQGYDAVGITIDSNNYFACNEAPCFNFWITFEFFKKIGNKWQFEFAPKLGLKYSGVK